MYSHDSWCMQRMCSYGSFIGGKCVDIVKAKRDKDSPKQPRIEASILDNTGYF